MATPPPTRPPNPEPIPVARLVLEASPGQTVNIDCQVLANPAKSVHFSWFASLGREQNLTDWLQRDASLDEQLDESR